MSEQPNKPDGLELTRQILHHLAGISGEVYQNHMLLADVLAHLTKRSPKKFRHRYALAVAKLTSDFYRASLKAANLSDPEEPPPAAKKTKRRRPRGPGGDRRG